MGSEGILKIGDKVKFRENIFDKEEIKGEVTHITDNYVTVRYEKNGGTFEDNLSKDKVDKVEPTFYFTWSPHDTLECALDRCSAEKENKATTYTKYERPVKLIMHGLSNSIITKNDNLLYPYPKIDKIEEKRKISENADKNGVYTTFMWKGEEEPTILRRGLDDKGSLEEAFLYAFFYQTMKQAKGWSKTKSKKFLNSLQTEQKKKALMEEQKEKEKIQTKEKMQKEHEQKVIKLAKRELKKQNLQREIAEQVEELKKKGKKKCGY